MFKLDKSTKCTEGKRQEKAVWHHHFSNAFKTLSVM